MPGYDDDEDWVGRAKRVLEDTGAEEIASASESRADYTGPRAPAPSEPGVTQS